jgi:hypothetical protein
MVLMRRRRSSHQKGVAFGKQRVASLVQSTDRRHPKGSRTEQVQSTDPFRWAPSTTPQLRQRPIIFGR